MSANMSAYIWWYIVQVLWSDRRRDDFSSANTGNITHKGYVMSQYAKFVRPGFYRVYSTVSSATNAYVTAYKRGSSVVIVVVNMASSPLNMTFSLVNGTANAFSSFVTSGTENCLEEADYTVSKGGFTATMEASSVTTFVTF